jgi:phosphoribosylamine--glycine ligase
MNSDGIKFKGILYAGLMIKDGKPSVLEFNCRLGDPETQPVLSRLSTDLLDICLALTEGKLADIDVQWKSDPSVCVVLASGGYPGKYEKGKEIMGLDDVKNMEDVMVFHAGTAFRDDQIVTSGGRVLGVTATGADIRAAQKKAYEAIDKISFEGMHYRRDIAYRALK